MYVERRESGHRGEAWIGLVSFSRSGRTVYFNGDCFNRYGGLFWVSGVKRCGTNRHVHGAGPIKVDRRAVGALLEHLGVRALDPSRFIVADAIELTERRRAELHAEANAELER